MATERQTPAEAIAEAAKRGAEIRAAAKRAAEALRADRDKQSATGQTGSALGQGQGT